MAEEIKETVETNSEVKEEKTEETKTEVKEEPKAEETKEQPKEETKEEPKEEPKVEVKEETKEVEYNFKFPKDLKVEESEVAKLKELSKELKLSNEQAQKFVDFTANQAKLFGDKAFQDFNKMKEDWGKQTKDLYTDEQIGNAGKVAREVGGEKFVELLETTGLANNPLVVGFLEKVSANYTNDKLVIGKTSGGEPTEKQILDVMYPNTK